MLTEHGLRTVLVLAAGFRQCRRRSLPASMPWSSARKTGRSRRRRRHEATRRAIEPAEGLGQRAIPTQVLLHLRLDAGGQHRTHASTRRSTPSRVTATIVCPALPVNDRTVYQGHLFVGSRLLSESPLRNHPLNPMTDANIVRWLGYQTSRESRPDRPVVRTPRRRRATKRHVGGNASPRAVSYIVTDAASDEDLYVIAAATRDWPLVSGGSGITAAWPRCTFHDAPCRRSIGELAARGSGNAGGFRQSVAGRRDGKRNMPCRTAGRGSDWTCRPYFAARCDLEAIVARARRQTCRSNRPVLVYSPSDLDAAASDGLVDPGPRPWDSATWRPATALPTRCPRWRMAVGFQGGGSTASWSPAARRPGAVCRRLGIQAVEVGRPISPGVPYCFTWPDRRLLLVLKSGNFGDEDLYSRVRDLK